LCRRINEPAQKQKAPAGTGALSCRKKADQYLATTGPPKR
jgi:hypothetical protein